MKQEIERILSRMSLEQKAGLCSGSDFWHLKTPENDGTRDSLVSDEPHGLRKQDEKADHPGINDSIRAVCFPPAVLSARSFDRELMKGPGDAIGQEEQAEGVSVVLGLGSQYEAQSAVRKKL